MMHSKAGKISLSSLSVFALVLASTYGIVYYLTPQTAQAAMAFFQSTTCNGTVSPIVTTNFGSTVVAGDLIVVTVVDDAGVAEPGMTVTDTGGNTYTRIADTLAANTGTQTMWYARVVTGGSSFNVTVTNAGGAFARLSCVAQEFNGFTGTATFDKISAYATGASTAALSASSGTLTDANELVVGSFAHYATISAFTLGSGYTNLGTVNVANAASAQESKVVAATTAVTAPATIAASREWTAYVATFRDVAAAGGSTPTDTTFINVNDDE